MSNGTEAPLLVVNQLNISSINNELNQQYTHQKCINIWLKLCSYTMNIYYIAIIFLLITSAVAAENYFSNWNDWTQIVRNLSNIMTVYATFLILHRNIRREFINGAEYVYSYNKIEYYFGSIGFIFTVTLIRFMTYDSHICPSSNSIQHAIGQIGSLFVNLATMYTLNLTIFYLCLQIIAKYDVLEQRIKNESNITMDNIKYEWDKIKKETINLQQKWQFIVTISCFYHILFATLTVTIWLLQWTSNTSVSYWVYCPNDEWTQLCIIIIRSCVRIFGLLYGILRLNQKPKKLANVMNEYCGWQNDKEQIKIIRMKMMLEEFTRAFKVFGIQIKNKHFIAIIIAALTAMLTSLAKSRLMTLFSKANTE